MKLKSENLPLADIEEIKLHLSRLEGEIAELEKKDVLPDKSSISRYSVTRGTEKIFIRFHYYKLYNPNAVYRRSNISDNKKSRYLHLGRAWTKRFAETVLAMENSKILEIKRKTREYLQNSLEELEKPKSLCDK
ncbi:hypothetical protein [Mastigocoleus testarum]|uniref:Uncharacterized protein n=1 Tax=Mastigocoleus testarum BC008 TaxID=371196 RepID=A0A0V7ZBF5_9CYAN|nr:hypothetical protein [Mastigocoleus testarum]KST61842.1 hypothetical protein BC008_07295 [Mastigocoleus testarum BC008]KST61843.1 hypothetical protein BC008_07300 [Mastigocoleus testarum BC008]